MSPLEDLRERWMEAWPRALACWSPFVKLRDPVFCLTEAEQRANNLSESFAKIGLADQDIWVGLVEVDRRGLQDLSTEVLAHEIGHHIFAPGDLGDHARALMRARRGLPGQEQHAPLIVNLYQDLLINDRLQRSARLDMAGLYRRMEASRPKGEKTSSLWNLYMRIYEILWALQSGTLARGPVDDATEGDAQLGARLIRSYAHDWLRGSGRFAALCLRYLIADGKNQPRLVRAQLDATELGKGGEIPMGLGDLDPGELSECQHPSLDPVLTGLDGEGKEEAGAGEATGQAREPFELGQVLRAMGMNVSDEDLAARYYREKALPHIIPFPRRELPQSEEPEMEGLEPWDFGSPLEDVDWLESVIASPRVVPGVTTRQRFWGKMDGAQPRVEPVDLDLYLDCSGSMPNPRTSMSFLALAGTIVMLSALRVGSAVQATLWSGVNQFVCTPGFVRDEAALMRILTGFIGGGTAFPLHMFRKTYENRKPHDRPVHILIVSDEGVDTMASRDERGTDGMELARMALEKARAGGTMVLNLWSDKNLENPYFKLAAAMGWDIHRVTGWEQLVSFARAFSRRQYYREPAERRR